MNGVTTAKTSAIGRPRKELHQTVFAAALELVDELGYAKATCDRVAAAAGIAKTTVYRRWPTKGDLIVDALLDVFGPVDLRGADTRAKTESAIRWMAGKIEQPGVGAAFAGVFSDAIRDAALREMLAARFQEPYKLALEEALGEPEHRVLFLIDVVTGTLLHRMGMTGEPMSSRDVTALVAMAQGQLGHEPAKAP